MAAQNYRRNSSMLRNKSCSSNRRKSYPTSMSAVHCTSSLKGGILHSKNFSLSTTSESNGRPSYASSSVYTSKNLKRLSDKRHLNILLLMLNSRLSLSSFHSRSISQFIC